jgi:hypothetical protein
MKAVLGVGWTRVVANQWGVGWKSVEVYIDGHSWIPLKRLRQLVNYANYGLPPTHKNWLHWKRLVDWTEFHSRAFE